MASSPGIDRREPPEISERLQYLGWRVVGSGGSGGADPEEAKSMPSITEEAGKVEPEGLFGSEGCFAQLWVRGDGTLKEQWITSPTAV